MSVVAELIRQLELQGFTWRTTKKNHLMIYSPDGRLVTTLAGTPSDHRSIRNTISALRRAGFEWKGR